MVAMATETTSIRRGTVRARPVTTWSPPTWARAGLLTGVLGLAVVVSPGVRVTVRSIASGGTGTATIGLVSVAAGATVGAVLVWAAVVKMADLPTFARQLRILPVSRRLARS